MARKSMKSRVPADVWAALTEMRRGSEASVYELGEGGQGVVFGVRGNDEWVIKRWHKAGDATALGTAEVEEDWRAYDVAKDIARGLLSDTHLPHIIYAVGRYVVMERLAEEADWPVVEKVMQARDMPARSLSHKWRRVRKAIRKLESRGYNVNDICGMNMMYRKDGTLVLNDVVA